MTKLDDSADKLAVPTGQADAGPTPGVAAIDHRDKSGGIALKYGNTLIHTLRVKYGYTFAGGESNSAKLIDVIERLDETSLQQLVRDRDA